MIHGRNPWAISGIVIMVESRIRKFHMITSEEVARRVELYFTGGALNYLTSQQARLAKNAFAGVKGEGVME